MVKVIEKAVNGIIEKAKKDDEILAVALFGSYARGESHRDIDVCIFLKNKKYDKYFLSKKNFNMLSQMKSMMFKYSSCFLSIFANES